MLVGLLAVCAFHRLLSERVSSTVALMMTLWLSFAPMTAVFSMAYTEALALFLLILMLVSLVEKRYYHAILPILLLSLTRPLGIAIAALLVVILVGRFLQREEFPKKERIALCVVTLVAGLGNGIWPLIVGVRFGEWDTYLKVSAAWRGDMSFTSIASYMLRPQDANLAVYSTYVAIIVGFSLALLAARQQKWPWEIQAWAVVYVLYLAVSVQAYFVVGQAYVIHSSIYRYLFLALVPFAPVIASISPKMGRVRKIVIFGVVFVILAALNLLYANYFAVSMNGHALQWP